MRPILIFITFVLLFGCTQTSQPSVSAPESPSAVQQPAGDSSAEPSVTDSTVQGTQPEPEPQTALKSEEISYISHGWNIGGTMYPAKNKANPTKSIILLHALGETRDSYPVSFIEKLHDGVPEAVIIAIDMRGHGESTDPKSWEQFSDFEFKGMQNDVTDAAIYVNDRYPTVDEHYVVGASIGSTAAILAGARETDIVKVAMISPGMEYRGISIESAADDYLRPLLLVASSGDTYSEESIGEIESLSSSLITKKIYSGSAHGTDLFAATANDAEPLDDVIIKFLK